MWDWQSCISHLQDEEATDHRDLASSDRSEDCLNFHLETDVKTAGH